MFGGLIRPEWHAEVPPRHSRAGSNQYGLFKLGKRVRRRAGLEGQGAGRDFHSQAKAAGAPAKDCLHQGILEQKERDLMFVGGGQFGDARTPQEEESLFYQAYGQTPIDPIALAYYRYERIIEDIAVECQQIFLPNEGGADREQAFRYLTSNFLPNNVLEIAYRYEQE